MKLLATISLFICLTVSTYAADWYWATDLTRADAETVYRSYLLDNVSTNAAVAATPEVVTFIDGQTHVLDLDGATPAQLDTLAASMSAADIAAAAKVIEYAENGWSIAVQNSAASSIIAMAAKYGVTNVNPWADVSAAIVAEEQAALASSNDFRLLIAVSDGTKMLSYYEFYTANGGDILNVVAP
jgi:hypothetical protein